MRTRSTPPPIPLCPRDTPLAAGDWVFWYDRWLHLEVYQVMELLPRQLVVRPHGLQAHLLIIVPARECRKIPASAFGPS